MLNPNCSELVVRLWDSNITNFKKIAKQMIESKELSLIAKFTSEKDVSAVYIKLVPGSHKHIKSKKNGEDGTKVFWFDGLEYAKSTKDKQLISLMEQWKKRDGRFESNISASANKKDFFGDFIEPDSWWARKSDRYYDFYGADADINLYANCGFNSKKITAMGNDCWIESFPTIDLISRMFCQRVEPHDGGSELLFEEWQSVWYDEEDELMNDDYDDLTDEEDTDETIWELDEEEPEESEIWDSDLYEDEGIDKTQMEKIKKAPPLK